MGYRDNKRSLRQKMQDLMSTPKGQTVMNYAYNWGASIVIMGTLFKLTHLPGANFMLFAGMGTEVLIFFISAFDLSGVKREPSNEGVSVPMGGGPMSAVCTVVASSDEVAQTSEGNIPSGNVVAGGGGPSIVVVQGGSPVQSGGTVSAGTPMQTNVAAGTMAQPGGVVMTGQPGGAPITPEMEEATTAYLEQLKAMTEMLSRCTEQAQSVSQDTEQMNNLSKNLAGINAIYEMQLRSVSTQIGTIDQVHEQTRRMARQIEELNEVYARMLQAMTSNK